MLEPILWHVRLFQVIHRALLRLDSKAALATRAHEMRGTKTLVGILKSTIRSFFDHASDNPLCLWNSCCGGLARNFQLWFHYDNGDEDDEAAVNAIDENRRAQEEAAAAG